MIETMPLSMPLRWILVVVLAGAGGWFLFRGVRAGPGGAPLATTERVTHLAHALMAATMAVMIWPMG
jgi:hypothetical protein